MKRIKIIICIIIMILCTLIIGIPKYANSDIKHALQIDTNLDNAIFDKTGIHISGWKLATEADTKLKVSIDGQEVNEECITYSYKYDLISIIGGYGTYKENPLPNYDINIPTKDIVDGKHIIKIEFVLEDGTVLEKFEREIIIEKVKHALQIDTNLDNATFDKNGIKVSGWKLATEMNTKLKVSVDGQEVNEECITYSYKYDLISIIGGYGTYKENPLPNYDINIPTKDIVDGKHTIKIEFVLEDGTVLEKVEREITIDKSIKSALQIDTNLNEIIFNEKQGIHISGWKLATEADTKLIVSIDGKKISEDCITYSYKYDLISIIGGYGTYEENPKPNFDINISTKDLGKQDYNMKIQLVTSDEKTILKSENFVAKYGGRFKGVDVSSYNGEINWKQVASSGIDFAMIRIGYRGYRNPVIVRDSQALYNIKEAKAAGLKVGVYFVTQAINCEEAQEEALWVVSQLHQNGIYLDYPVAIDTEDSGARKNGNLPGRADLLDIDTRTIACRAFSDVIKYYGYTPAVYASSEWFKNKLRFSELDCYDIWLAHYTYDENKLSDFSGKYEIWQYLDTGEVLGISKNVDLNICYKKY